MDDIESVCQECGSPLMYGERHPRCGAVADKYRAEVDRLRAGLIQAQEWIDKPARHGDNEADCEACRRYNAISAVLMTLDTQ